MPRSGDEARRRLQQATLELFQQKGFDATTAAEIAERAGVTERTFFRHFADKREALFDGEGGISGGVGACGRLGSAGYESDGCIAPCLPLGPNRFSNETGLLPSLGRRSSTRRPRSRNGC